MIKTLLVGNPNTGKTTLFNNLTSSNEHVGNWHGVTVEERAKIYKYKNEKIKLVDLPGIYSLTAFSYEEEVSINYILNNQADIVINICDINNLERNLYLTLNLMELGCNIILAVNQIDKKLLQKTNFSKLEEDLGIKIVVFNASKKDEAKKINDEIIKLSQKLQLEERKNYNLPYINSFDFKQIDNLNLTNFEKIKILEDDEKIKNKYKITKNFEKIEEISLKRYEFIEKIISSKENRKNSVYGKNKLDKILLNKYLAFPIFFLFLCVAFYLTFFSVGNYISETLKFCLDKTVKVPLVLLCKNLFGEGSWILRFFEEAVIGGIGSIITFLPQVVLLLFFLTFLEDSGYLSRVAFVFDDILGKVGLSGKSVYTLLMGFGCSTTAVLTARTMDDKNSKIKTSLLAPYMSCSAKFPLYAVLGGAFFGAKNIFVILGLYFLGLFISVFVSFILEKTILKSKEQSFIMEFPPYRMISLKRTIKVLWKSVKDFVLRVASLILAMNIIVWILTNFSFTFRYVENGRGSILESLGKIISPLFIPLGFNNWGLSSALIAGLIAKEVIITSIAMFNNSSLNANVLTNPASAIFFTSKSAVLSFLVFCLLYSPCLATISVLRKEIGRKWTFFGIAIQFVIAYLVSLVIYMFARVFENYGTLKFLILLSVITLIALSIAIVAKFLKGDRRCQGCKKHCNIKK